MKTLTLATTLFFLSNSFGQKITFASESPSSGNSSTVEVREIIEEERSTLLFNLISTDWLKLHPELVEHITNDYSFISTLLFDPETMEMSVYCERNITLTEINELMKEFSISVYRYKGEEHL